jgi:hypothetical protein
MLSASVCLLEPTSPFVLMGFPFKIFILFRGPARVVPDGLRQRSPGNLGDRRGNREVR